MLEMYKVSTPISNQTVFQLSIGHHLFSVANLVSVEGRAPAL
jgi:hypothetical protein